MQRLPINVKRTFANRDEYFLQYKRQMKVYNIFLLSEFGRLEIVQKVVDRVSNEIENITNMTTICSNQWKCNFCYRGKLDIAWSIGLILLKKKTRLITKYRHRIKLILWYVFLESLVVVNFVVNFQMCIRAFSFIHFK